MSCYNYGSEHKILSISTLDNFPNRMLKKPKRKVMFQWVWRKDCCDLSKAMFSVRRTWA